MNKIIQHIPHFVDKDKPYISYFSSTRNLLSLHWIKHWSDDKDFLQWYKSDNRLIAKFKNGTLFVVGFISYPNKVDLEEL